MKNTLVFWLLIMAMTACAENSSSLVILQNQAPEDGCQASNSVSDNFVSHGTLDIGAADFGLTTQYYAWLVVSNNLKSTIESNGIELNAVEMKSAQIDLRLGAAGAGLEDFTSYVDYTFVTISPGETRSLQVNVIPPNLAGRLSIAPGQFVEAVAKIQLVGERGGSDIKTNSINLPITICNGCLAIDIGSCATATFPDTVYLGHTCNKSQDTPIHCCLDSSAGGGEAYRCPAVQSTATE
ncbi:hypothetical protein KKD52_01205 [Myxococcota bacterium]|nr:hypothetical protein [Myxococcota bacterium]MBU1411665.1 hypothetical protein [Myxococcota bacterium]MBU1508948.1 hypothetical protein [Myxococcota bacterium]